jgi:hypothetical protein
VAKYFSRKSTGIQIGLLEQPIVVGWKKITDQSRGLSEVEVVSFLADALMVALGGICLASGGKAG